MSRRGTVSLLSGVMVCTTGCGSTVRTYEGERLPKSDWVFLTARSNENGSVLIDSVNEYVARETIDSTGWPANRFEMGPGSTRVGCTLVWSNGYRRREYVRFHAHGGEEYVLVALFEGEEGDLLPLGPDVGGELLEGALISLAVVTWPVSEPILMVADGVSTTEPGRSPPVGVRHWVFVVEKEDGDSRYAGGWGKVVGGVAPREYHDLLSVRAAGGVNHQ